MKKIAVITSSRAEYGLLKPVYLELKKNKNLKTDLVVTGTHLVKKYGNTIEEIKKDDINIAHLVNIINEKKDESEVDIFSNSLKKFDELFRKERYDAILLLGDRFETLSFAIAATFNKIPIFHMHGGETTEGAIDEAIRHSITKMSYVHFTSCEEYKNRVIQLGEDPKRVYNVGSTGIENICKMKLLSKKELSKKLEISLDKYFVVTYHPTTLENNSYIKEFNNLLKSLEKYKNYQVIFTKSNLDEGGLAINSMIDEYVLLNNNAKAFYSLGMLKYLSLIKYASLVLGNSSSGIYEVPALCVPTINIGNRQKGRLMPTSVINCEGDEKSIICVMKKALNYKVDMKIENNIFYKKNTSKNIAKIIFDYLSNKRINLEKKFYDIR